MSNKKDEKSSYYKWRPELEEESSKTGSKIMYNTLNNQRGASISKKNSKSFRYT